MSDQAALRPVECPPQLEREAQRLSAQWFSQQKEETATSDSTSKRATEADIQSVKVEQERLWEMRMVRFAERLA